MITFVVRHTVRPASGEAYEAWLRKIMVVAAGYAGHHGVQIVRPPLGGNNYVTMVRFASRADADRWAHSQERHDLVDAVAELIEGKDTVEMHSGIDFWFTPESPNRPHPVRWKQWLMTTSVIWPLTMIVPPLYKPLFQIVPVLDSWGVSHGIIAATIVALVIYVVMPPYVRRVSHWLFR